MKKILFFTGVLAALSAGANAQNSFPTSNAIWNESIRSNYRVFGLLGDTTFNDTVYSKLYLFSDTILSEEYKSAYIGSFRNEGQKVFFKPAIWEQADILLYDFGVAIGDTVWHNAWIPPYGGNYIIPAHCSDCYSVVLNITTDENGRKIYSVTCPHLYLSWNDSWYEGIGSDKGVLFSLTTSYPDYWSCEDFILNCFKHNDTVKYMNNPKCDQCFCKKVNITESSYSDFISIFPNPTNDILNIKIRDNINIKSISIYSIEGKQIEKNKYSLKSKQLNVSKLTTGSYIINIQTDKGNFNQIFIKN